MATTSVKRLLRPPYFYLLSKRANREHDAREKMHTRGEFPHVLLVCVDALRRDRTLDLPLTFREAIAPSTWTVPSVTSTLTGRYPHEHGAVAWTDPADETFAVPEQATGVQTLPETFERAGYETAGLFGFPMPFVATRGWFQRHRVFGRVPAERVIDTYERWRAGQSRTFAYLHLHALHSPLEPPAEYTDAYGVDLSIDGLARLARYTESFDETSETYRRYLEHKNRLYDATLAYVEDQLQALLATVSDDTLVVVFGDHGEGLWDHHETDRQFTDSRPNYGVGHGGTPLDAVSRVPVGVSHDIAPSGGWASLIDLPATVTDAVFGTDGFGGHPWTGSIPTDRIALSEGVRYGVERKAAYRGEEKLLHSRTDDVTLTARIDDDGERFEPIDDLDPLRDALPDYWENVTDGTAADRVVADQLEALGYR